MVAEALITAPVIITDMAIPSEGSPTVSPIYILARTFVLLARAHGCHLGLGLFFLSLSGKRLSITSRLNCSRGGISSSKRFTTERQKVSTGTSQICNPTELRNAVVVNRAILVDLIPLGQTATDFDGRVVSKTRHEALWLVSLRTLLFGSRYFGLMRLSTDSRLKIHCTWSCHMPDGPNEGWIAYWRLQVALAYFDRLPRELSDNVVADFVKLLDTQILYNEAAAIFARSPDATKDRIIDALKNASPTSRLAFAKVLSDMGVKATIPNTKMPTLPFWQR